MESLVKLSFYCFSAASISFGFSTLAYLAFAAGRFRLKQSALATPDGAMFTSSTAEYIPGPNSAARFGTMLGWFGVFFAGLAVLFRTIVSERGPYSNMYEFSLAFIFAVGLIYLLFERMYGVKQLGAIVISVAFVMSLYIWSLPAHMREVDALNPALQNRPLMTAHVSSAILAYATFAVSFASAFLYLIASRKKISWLPSPEMLDDIGYRSVTFGFPLLALVLILGSVWAHQAWGSYWSWDPKETAALFTWLVDGVYLHTRTLRGWRGRRSAVVLLFGFGAVMFTYYGNYFFGGLHAYGGV